MNPFVNPKKRSISLPKGCKDLLDVLRLPVRKDEDAMLHIPPDSIILFIQLLLLQVHQERATELVIAPASDAGTPIRYRVDGTWYDMQSFPSHSRPGVVAEFERMARLPEGPFPKEGIVRMDAFGAQMQWRLRITGADADCILTLIQEN